MLKKLVLLSVLMAALLISCSVFADQDGKNCWCNVDQYGCWNTGDDGGKSYLMFWSEEARQYIMGTGSAPYKLVVEKPGSSGILSMKCGVPAPAVIPTPAPAAKTASASANKPAPAPDSQTESSDDKENNNTDKSDETVNTVDPNLAACIDNYSKCYQECIDGASSAYEYNMCGQNCTLLFNCYYVK